MKKLTLAIAMAALVIFAGCKKEQETAGTTLKASIEQQKGDDSRTSLNPTNGAINWTAGDKILVYNGTSTATFRLTAGAGSANGTFTYNGEYEITDNTMAVYPETCVITDTGVTFTLPEEQNLAAPGTFANGANPMLGINTSNGLTFVSICGGLGLSLTGDNVDITAIEIVSEGEMLTGTYTGYFNNDNIDVTNGTNSVRLNCTTTLTAEAQEFYIVLPVGVLGNGFTLNIYNGGDDPIFTKTTTTDLTVELNKVKKMNTLEVTVDNSLVVMERKYLVHYYSVYNYPCIRFCFDNGQCLSIGYFNAYYWGGWDGSIVGVHAISHPWNGNDVYWAPDNEGDKKDWYIAPAIHDEWVNEKVIIYPDGRVQYYMNDEYMGEELFDLLHLEEAESFEVRMEPYGWWTGHYTYVDDYLLRTPATTISDNFDDGVIDLNIWNAPTNPDGVFEQNGILELHQYRTDQDFRLISKSIPLH